MISNLAGSDLSPASPILKAMPNPSEKMLESPEFNALWDIIKHWDINVSDYYKGYCGGNGSHVTLLLEALMKIKENHK